MSDRLTSRQSPGGGSGDDPLLQEALGQLSPLETSALKAKVAERLGLVGSSAAAAGKAAGLSTQLSSYSPIIKMGLGAIAMVGGTSFLLLKGTPPEVSFQEQVVHQQLQTIPEGVKLEFESRNDHSVALVLRTPSQGPKHEPSRGVQSGAEPKPIAPKSIAPKATAPKGPLASASSKRRMGGGSSAQQQSTTAAAGPHLVYQAAVALRQERDPRRALQLLDRVSVDQKETSEEVLALKMEALARLGAPRAKKVAQHYLDAYPQGRYRTAAQYVSGTESKSDKAGSR